MKNKNSLVRRLVFASCTLTLLAHSTQPLAEKPTSQETKLSRADSAAAETLYKTHCGTCHGADRAGSIGPALLPENLSRLKAKAAFSVIKEGRTASQMPAFADKLNENEIQNLTDYIYQPSKVKITWEETNIRNSHKLLTEGKQLSNKPQFKADPMNLFIVVESGDHHATLLDGDSFEPITRFKTHFALHGGPKYSPDGRFVYFASRDGWVTKYDIYNLTKVADVRVGINTRNIAVSHDGRYVAAANYLPNSIVLLDAKDLSFIKMLEVSKDGEASRVSAIYTAPQRSSFIAALKDVKEVWELPYEKTIGEVRKLPVDTLLDDFFFDQDYRYLIGSSREKKGVVVIDMDSGKVEAEIDLPGMPHLGSGIIWNTGDQTVLATPNLSESAITFIDTKTWKPIKKLETKGPGFFMRSHENSDYAWTDVFFGPNKDLVHIIDKKSLAIVKTLQPEPGKTAAHVEFTKDGRYALLSIWENDGAVIVYDAKTFEEVKRLPMNKPSGKYNVFNKIHYSSGTSH